MLAIFFFPERYVLAIATGTTATLTSRSPLSQIYIAGRTNKVSFTDRTGQIAGVWYRSGLAGNWSVPIEFKFEFKKLSSTGSYRYTDRLDRFTGRFDRFEFKSKFKIACVTGLERYTSQFDRFTGRFDRFTKWALMGRLIFFLFFFGLTLNSRKVC